MAKEGAALQGVWLHTGDAKNYETVGIVPIAGHGYERCGFVVNRNRLFPKLEPLPDYRFQPRMLARMAVRGIGSEIAKSITPHLFHPVHLVKGYYSLTGRAYLDMRRSVDAKRGEYDTWDGKTKFDTLSRKVSLRRGNVTLSYDPHTGCYFFDHSEMSMELFLEFMALVIRDELTKEVDIRYHIPWIAVRDRNAWAGTGLAPGEPKSLPRLRGPAEGAVEVPLRIPIANTFASAGERTSDEPPELADADDFSCFGAGEEPTDSCETGPQPAPDVPVIESTVVDGGLTELATLALRMNQTISSLPDLPPGLTAAVLSLWGVLGITIGNLEANGVTPLATVEAPANPGKQERVAEAYDSISQDLHARAAALAQRELSVKQAEAELRRQQEELDGQRLQFRHIVAEARRESETFGAEKAALEELRASSAAAEARLVSSRAEIRQEVLELVASAEAELSRREKALDEREAALNSREADVAAEEERLLGDMEELQAQRQQLDREKEALRLAKVELGRTILSREEGAARTQGSSC